MHAPYSKMDVNSESACHISDTPEYRKIELANQNRFKKSGSGLMWISAV